MGMMLRRHRGKPDKDEPVDEKTFSDPPVDETPKKKTTKKG